MISIVIPSYGRASRISGVLHNIRQTTITPYEIVVVVEPDQHQEYMAALVPSNDTILVINERSRSYAGAVNTAVKFALGDYLFMGSDDLNFHSGWDTEALRVMNALPNIQVVGTNDLWNKFVLEGVHATHYLVSKTYVDDPGGVVDGERGLVLYEGYDHNYTDTEFIGTAKARAAFAPCLTSVVEHLHFTAGKSLRDDTYRKGYAEIEEDARTYLRRRELWWNISK